MSSLESSFKHPVEFNRFFELGQEETESPFLTNTSRMWGINIRMRTALLSCFFLLLSFLLSFYPQFIPLSHLALISVYFLVGIPALIESFEELSDFNISIDILMTLAAFSSVIIGSGMEGGLLLVLFALSESMEDLVATKAKSSISALLKIAPTKASIIENDGKVIERSLREVKVGETILVKSGQIIPLDGDVIDGISSINLSHLTGESLPILKKIGDTVPAGARNLEGSLTVRVNRTSADSTLAKIIELVTLAQEEKPVLQRWFDKFSHQYAITIISLFFLFATCLPFFFSMPYLGVEGSIYRALAFLIAASPCALIIALPIAYLSAIGACARKGILLKGGITLDALSLCKIVAFDKTGTLTTGELSFIDIEPVANREINGAEKENLLSIAYALEKGAVHPIARAIIEYGNENRLPSLAIRDFKSLPGYGVSAFVNFKNMEHLVYVGNLDYLKEHDKLDLTELNKKIKIPKEKGELVAVLLFNNELFLLRFLDKVRHFTGDAIKELQELNLRLVMLTGDHEESAKRVAKELNIDEYHANLKPEDKLKFISQLSSEKNLVMIGDGVNDAPALARATVGICMGKVGSTSAIDAADAILLHDNIEHVGWLMQKAHQTQKIVKQNLILALFAILLASLPALLGWVPLWLAVIMHEGGTVLVGLNGLRLART